MTTKSLNGLTFIATYKFDHGTEYGFHCGKCQYDVGNLKFMMGKCPMCDLKPAGDADCLSDCERIFDDIFHLAYGPRPITSRYDTAYDAAHTALYLWFKSGWDSSLRIKNHGE